jgi:hypothetical protein
LTGAPRTGESIETAARCALAHAAAAETGTVRRECALPDALPEAT